MDYNGEIPEGFEVIELPASKYLMFQGEPFAEEDFGAAIEEIQDVQKEYDPAVIGYQWDRDNPRIQLEPVGTHTSGYTGFYYDITDFINIGGENIVAMRVDAFEREGWWYEGGGIYRHVRLEVVDSVHIEPWGMAVWAKPDLETGTAAVKISANILNRYFEEKQVRVEAEIRTPDGREISSIDGIIPVKEWDSMEYSDELELCTVTLWDVDHPYLYSAVIRLYLGETVCDEYTVNFGIRDIRFDPDSGFYLNGRNIKIKGLCCHHDHAGVGQRENPCAPCI